MVGDVTSLVIGQAQSLAYSQQAVAAGPSRVAWGELTEGEIDEMSGSEARGALKVGISKPLDAVN